MLKQKIKCHRMINKVEEQHFFILSKGNNAGKPLEVPCPNCFVFRAKDESERHFYYWLCFGLWQGGLFRPFLSGSVISFIHLDDLVQVIEEASAKVNLKPSAFENAITLLNKLNDQAKVITQQVELIKKAKKVLMYKVLR